MHLLWKKPEPHVDNSQQRVEMAWILNSNSKGREYEPGLERTKAQVLAVEMGCFC